MATGWAGHNRLWSFRTDLGVFAVKEIGRQTAAELGHAADLEAAAHHAGVPCPRPIGALNGSWTVTVGGDVFRCHDWVDAQSPTGSLTSGDAEQAGQALGRLHTLALPWHPDAASGPYMWGPEHWRSLREAAARHGLRWSSHLAAASQDIAAIETTAAAWSADPHIRVGSHRDVRPDNTLRCPDRLLLVDWDSAGPTVPGREVAAVLRWWDPHQDAFLAGYESVAGPVDLAQGAGENGALLWWLELNIRLALDQPANQDRQDAVAALLADLFPTAEAT